MNERQASDKWLYARLAAAAAVTALVSTRIYAGIAPEKATAPFIVFAYLGGENTHAAGQGSRILVRQRYAVRAVTEGVSFASADAIANAVDTALVTTLSSVSVGAQSFTVIGCWQETPLAYPETTDGRDYRHSGGVYVIDIHSS